MKSKLIKIISCLLVLIFTLGIVACDKQEDAGDSKVSKTTYQGTHVLNIQDTDK